jgi:hypothetical protein
MQALSRAAKILIISFAVLPFLVSASYAQSTSSSESLPMQFNTADYTIGLKVIGSPIVFDKPNQPIPFIANGSNYAFDITFLNRNGTTNLKNVDYNIVILADGTEVFNAQNQSSSAPTPLHTSTGNVTIHQKFEKPGSAVIRVSILGVGGKAINNNSADFRLQVEDSKSIPEFPLALSIAGVGTSVAVLIVRVKKRRSSASNA